MEVNNVPRSSNLHAHVNREKAKQMDLLMLFLHLAGTMNAVPGRKKKKSQVWRTHTTLLKGEQRTTTYFAIIKAPALSAVQPVPKTHTK